MAATMKEACKKTISEIHPRCQNSIIVGLIIRSQNPKSFDSMRSRYNAGTRSVWNFTLRDTIEDFINVTVWGSVEFVNKLFTTFHLGSVVEVINAKITDRNLEDVSELYSPSVTSSCQLTLNQTSSLIIAHDSPAVPIYRKLLGIPTKNPAHAQKLKTITDRIEELRDTFVDVIVAVTFISQTREIFTRSGELTKIREFEVCDDTMADNISLALWDTEWIRLADSWKPKETILFLSDAQIAYNDKMKKSALTIARKTIITVNPEITEAMKLRDSMRNKPDMQPKSPFSVPNPNSITRKMTILEITERLNIASLQGTDERFQLLVIVKAIVEDLNIDNGDNSVVLSKCAKCKRIIPADKDSCMNLDCPFGNGLRVPINITTFNVLVNLRDETGYLVGCRLKDEAAEKAFGCNAEELKKMSTDERLKLKGKFYKEKCDVRLQIIGPTTSFPKVIYNILEITITKPEDPDLYEDFDIDQIQDHV